MVGINEEGYVDRRSKNGHGKRRDWWLVKQNTNNSNSCGGVIHIATGVKIFTPEKYLGKRVRLKIELLDKEEENAERPKYLDNIMVHDKGKWRKMR